MAGFVRHCGAFCNHIWVGMSKKLDLADQQEEELHQMQTGKNLKKYCPFSSGTLWKTALSCSIATTTLIIARHMANCASDNSNLTCIRLGHLIGVSLTFQIGSIIILVFRDSRN